MITEAKREEKGRRSFRGKKSNLVRLTVQCAPLDYLIFTRALGKN
jgi:hypothetical protein